MFVSKTYQDLRHADDNVLMADSERKFKKLLDKVVKETERRGLKAEYDRKQKR